MHPRPITATLHVDTIPIRPAGKYLSGEATGFVGVGVNCLIFSSRLILADLPGGTIGLSSKPPGTSTGHPSGIRVATQVPGLCRIVLT